MTYSKSFIWMNVFFLLFSSVGASSERETTKINIYESNSIFKKILNNNVFKTFLTFLSPNKVTSSFLIKNGTTINSNQAKLLSDESEKTGNIVLVILVLIIVILLILIVYLIYRIKRRRWEIENYEREIDGDDFEFSALDPVSNHR